MTDDAELRALREQVQALKARQASFRLATVVEPLPSTPVGYVRVQVPGPGPALLEMDLPHPENSLPEVGAEVTLGMSGHTPFVTAQRGTTLGFSDPTGNVLGGVDSLGRGQFTAVSSVEWPQINAADWTGKGGRLDGILDRRPRSVSGWGAVTVPGPQTTTVAGIGWFEIQATLHPGRLYRLCTSTFQARSTDPAASVEVQIRYTTAEVGTLTAQPGVTSVVVAKTQAGIGFGCNLERLYRIPFGLTTPMQYRFLLSYSRLSGTAPVWIHASVSGEPVQMSVEDVGPFIEQLTILNDGGTNGTGGAGSGATVPAPTRRTVTVPAAWTRTYKSDGTERTGLTDAGQGYTDLSGLQRSLIGFPVIPELVGATVETVTVYLHNRYWRQPSGGTADIGTHGLSAAPATLGATPAQDLLRVPDWPRSGGKWVPMPLDQGWASGTLRGVQLGATTLSSDPVFDGRFAGALDTDETRRPQLSITYIK